MKTALLVTLVLTSLLCFALLFKRLRRRRDEQGGRAALVLDYETGSLADAPASTSADPGSEPALPQDTPHPLEEPVHEIGPDFYEEVVGLLESELSANPRRSDLRFKLLEMYAATHRKAEFVELAKSHLSAEKGETDPRWTRIAEMGRSLAPGDGLFTDAATENDSGSETAKEAPKQFRRYYDAVDASRLDELQTELHKAYQDLRQDAGFWKILHEHCDEIIGPRTPVVHAERLSSFVGGAQIYVKNDAERPAGDAAAISAIGQAVLAQALGRKRVIAAPASEGHAVAVARAARTLGLEAHIVVTEGEQALRADELALTVELGARLFVIPDGKRGVSAESQRGALAQALDDRADALYVSPLAAGPFPYPVIVRELQGLVGRDLKTQVRALAGRSPDGIIVSASDGMPAIGFLQAFLAAFAVKLFCVEAGAGLGSRHHRLNREHAWLRATGRVRYSSVPEEVARFAASYCLPDDVGALNLAGGEVLVETFTLSRRFSAEQVVVMVIPAAPPEPEAASP